MLVEGLASPFDSKLFAKAGHWELVPPGLCGYSIRFIASCNWLSCRVILPSLSRSKNLHTPAGQ